MSSSSSFVSNLSLRTFRYVCIHLNVQADEWWFIVFSFNFFLYILHLYMRSSERHSLATTTTTTTRPKYSSRFNYIYISTLRIYSYFIYVCVCIYTHIGAVHFIPVSPLLSLSLAHFSLQSIYVYIDNEKHRHKFIFVGGGDNLVYFASSSSSSTKVCHSNVCWYLVSLKYTLLPLQNNNNSTNNKNNRSV